MAEITDAGIQVDTLDTKLAAVRAARDNAAANGVSIEVRDALPFAEFVARYAQGLLV